MLIWFSGLLLTELTTVGERTGLGILKPVIVFLGALAVGIHLTLFALPENYTYVLLYIRNQMLAWSFLLGMVQILDFLKFHHMFGPWAIIISSLLVDLGKFMTVLCLFLIGFSMLITAMNTPFFDDKVMDGDDSAQTSPLCPTLPTKVSVTGKKGGGGVPGGKDVAFGSGMPLQVFIKLFFSLFGLSNYHELNMTSNNPAGLMYLFQIVFALYMLVTTIVLINLLIAMMSDTYQRIQAQSDVEWKFGLSKLIRAMHRTDMACPPINLFTYWKVVLVKLCKQGRKRKVGDFSRMDSRMEDPRPEKTANGPTEGNTTKRNKMVNGLKVPSPSAPTGGSTASMRDMNLLENIIDWQSVIKKYKAVVKNNS